MSSIAGDVITRLFVVGFPRSGTTLVQSLFAAHGQVLALPESHLLPTATARVGPFHLPWIARCSSSAPSGHRSSTRLPICSQRGVLREFVRQTDAATQRGEFVAWAEKTPAHLHFVDLIQSVVPDVRIVHVVRDPVPAITSLYRATNEFPDAWGGPRTLETCIRRWNKDLRITARRADRQQHTVVRYEELLADPSAVVERLFARVGLPLHGLELSDVLARRTEAGRAVVGADEPWKRRTLGPIGPGAGPHDGFSVFGEPEVTRILQATKRTRYRLERLPSV